VWGEEGRGRKKRGREGVKEEGEREGRVGEWVGGREGDGGKEEGRMEWVGRKGGKERGAWACGREGGKVGGREGWRERRLEGEKEGGSGGSKQARRKEGRGRKDSIVSQRWATACSTGGYSFAVS